MIFHHSTSALLLTAAVAACARKTLHEKRNWSIHLSCGRVTNNMPVGILPALSVVYNIQCELCCRIISRRI